MTSFCVGAAQARATETPWAAVAWAAWPTGAASARVAVASVATAARETVLRNVRPPHGGCTGKGCGGCAVRPLRGLCAGVAQTVWMSGPRQQDALESGTVPLPFLGDSCE